MANYEKDELWLSIDPQYMGRESMNSFLKFLHQFNVEYITYQSEGGKRVYMRLFLPNEIVFNGNHEFHKGMGEWVYYNPINLLTNKPKISDYNITEDMSIEPYDTDKWS